LSININEYNIIPPFWYQLMFGLDTCQLLL